MFRLMFYTILQAFIIVFVRFQTRFSFLKFRFLKNVSKDIKIVKAKPAARNSPK
jgi:hypothetical protein